MPDKRIIIAGTGSGTGKTTVTLGLMAALSQKGYEVQGFKCGPDFIDPSYHTAVTGRVSRNLDSWLLSEETLKDVYIKGSSKADISVIEGVMGLFDGKGPLTNEGSTAEISRITNTKVILVVDCYSMARSAAAIVQGFQNFTDEITIAGVIANRVGGEGHYKIIKEAVEKECGVPVFGYLPYNPDIELPERHLGLVPSIERGDLDDFFKGLGESFSETVNLDLLLELSVSEYPDISDKPYFSPEKKASVRIAVAKDEAFSFYYEENFEILESCGAELVFFSPLKGELLPEDVHGLYIGGGFPEVFAKELEEQKEVKKSILISVEKGLPVLAECGGFMFLCEKIIATDGSEYKMAGAIPGVVKMQESLAAIGYRELTGADGNYLLPGGTTARGHEFHYSVFHTDGEYIAAWKTTGTENVKREGYQDGNLMAGYTHFHFASCPLMAERWIGKCEEWKQINFVK